MGILNSTTDCREKKKQGELKDCSTCFWGGMKYVNKHRKQHILRRKKARVIIMRRYDLKSVALSRDTMIMCLYETTPKAIKLSRAVFSSWELSTKRRQKFGFLIQIVTRFETSILFGVAWARRDHLDNCCQYQNCECSHDVAVSNRVGDQLNYNSHF